MKKSDPTPDSTVQELRKIYIRFEDSDKERSLNENLCKRTGYKDIRQAKKITLTEFGLFDTLKIQSKHQARAEKLFFDGTYKHWNALTPYYQEKHIPYGLIELHTNKSSEALTEILEQKITDKTESVWFPKLNRTLPPHTWISEGDIHPRYPIYIISKGRPQCITAKALTRMGVRFHIVIEGFRPTDSPLERERKQKEQDTYTKIWGDRIIVGDFDTTTRSSIPVRNWVDEHAQTPKYWLLDDNIEDFNCLNKNQKFICRTPTIFAATEDFVEQFTNVGQAGLNYFSFAKKTDRVPPYYSNTRIYSCILMDKEVGKKIKEKDGVLWRGRYNEDTDLSIRILKMGYCTILMNAFLAGKVTTQRMKGGNTDSVYTDGDRRRTFAESLQKQHPDIVQVVWRFKRWHHLVDYSRFKQQLNPNPSMKRRDYKLKLHTDTSFPIRYETQESERNLQYLKTQNIEYTIIKLTHDPLSFTKNNIPSVHTEITLALLKTQYYTTDHRPCLTFLKKYIDGGFNLLTKKSKEKLSHPVYFLTPKGLIKANIELYYSKNKAIINLGEPLIQHALKHDKIAIIHHNKELFLWNISRNKNFYNPCDFDIKDWITTRVVQSDFSR